MKDLNLLEEVILDQSNSFLRKDPGMEREVDFGKYLKTKQIVVISGIRRCGKSTLLKQFSLKLKDFYYINFEDERLLDFALEDFNNLLILWKKNFNSKNVLMDEIQNVDKWELFVSRLKEEGYKVFITGSNSKLLSSELATRLTGRYFLIKLYPFSFKEFLALKKINYNRLTLDTKIKILKLFDEYLFNGGFPDFAIYQDEEFLETTYRDIIYKDIIARFKIREIKRFRQFANFLFTNFARELNYRGIAEALKIKSPTSVINYIGALEESYLIFELFKYDYSEKEHYKGNKKIYVIDNGMRRKIAFSFSEDRGRFLENMVFIELKRRGKEVFYFKNEGECDFVINEKGKIKEAIQVCSSLNNFNEKREVNGLIEAMEKFKLKKGYILTENQEEKKVIGDKEIDMVPVWKYCLDSLRLS
ncbi:MAG: ATP-binding protein [Candidatus Pacebacteria bacterium]|nr:ATP-binding protein [Candidatus Paceibacterota bacterium]